MAGMQITVPRRTLLVLSGPAACGKSTFAARRFLLTQIVSSDICRAMVGNAAASIGFRSSASLIRPTLDHGLAGETIVNVLILDGCKAAAIIAVVPP